MIAGNVKDENEEVIAALRTINSDIGYVIKDGKVMLIGKEIANVMRTLKALSKVKNVDIINEHNTAAMLELRDQETIYIGRTEENRGEVICAIA